MKNLEYDEDLALYEQASKRFVLLQCQLVQANKFKSSMDLGQYKFLESQQSQKENMQVATGDMAQHEQYLSVNGCSKLKGDKMAQIHERQESSESSKNTGFSPYKKDSFSFHQDQSCTTNDHVVLQFSPNKNLKQPYNSQQPIGDKFLSNIEVPRIGRKLSALNAREAFRNRCKNSLILNKQPHRFGAGGAAFQQQPSQVTGETSEQIIKSATSNKSYSVKSSNYSHNGDEGNNDEEESQQDDISPLIIQDIDVKKPEFNSCTKSGGASRKSSSKIDDGRQSLTQYVEPLSSGSCPGTTTHRRSSPTITSCSDIKLQYEELAFEDKYTQEDYLGEGCSSIVRVWKLIRPPYTKYAVKEMRVPDTEYFDIALKEFKLINDLNHPNIMKVYDIFYNQLKEKIYTVMEYAGHGSDLYKYIKESKDIEQAEEHVVLTEEKIKSIMRMLLDGLNYLHDEKHICHRDIKPSNLYVTKDLTSLKILDFNVALRFTPDSKMFGVTGEEMYSAPELTLGKMYDQKVDMWSAGIVLYSLLTRGKKLQLELHRREESHYADNQSIQDFVNSKIRKNIKTSFEINELICKCLRVDPNERVSAQEALKMAWNKQDNEEQPPHIIKQQEISDDQISVNKADVEEQK